MQRILVSYTWRGPLPVQEIGSWWSRQAQIDVVGINRTTRQVIFGKARWRATAISQKDVDVLMEKGLLWLHGDSARWDVHYAMFAKSITEQITDDDSVTIFTPEAISGLHTT